LIVEDSIITPLGAADAYKGGPLRAIDEFLGQNSEFTVDRAICDYFGKNVAWNVNGYLRRR
jgi:cephalosporin hydroxylase